MPDMSLALVAGGEDLLAGCGDGGRRHGRRLPDGGGRRPRLAALSLAALLAASAAGAQETGAVRGTVTLVENGGLVDGAVIVDNLRVLDIVQGDSRFVGFDARGSVRLGGDAGHRLRQRGADVDRRGGAAHPRRCGRP